MRPDLTFYDRPTDDPLTLLSKLLSLMLGIEKCRLTIDWLAHLCLGLGEEDVNKGDAIVEHSLTGQVMLGEIT